MYRNVNQGWIVNRPISTKTRLIAAPSHSDQLFALDKMNGKVLWSYTRGKHNYLLGIYNNKVIISGAKITALDVTTGKVIWAQDSDGGPFGRGTLHNGVIYHPTRVGLTLLNAKNGKTIYSRKWDGDLWSRGGNVIITGGKVVICGYNKITVYDSIITDINNPVIPLIETKTK